jgi:hypothetical protein
LAETKKEEGNSQSGILSTIHHSQFTIALARLFDDPMTQRVNGAIAPTDWLVDSLAHRKQ